MHLFLHCMVGPLLNAKNSLRKVLYESSQNSADLQEISLSYGCVVHCFSSKTSLVATVNVTKKWYML